MIGIYCITNKINNKKYIGQSKDVQKRLCRHIGDLIRGNHVNIHLQNSFIKYGIDNFSFEPIVVCNKDMLNKLEIYFIKKYKTHDKRYGFNKTFGGDSPVHTEEIRKKISSTQKGRKLTPEWKQNVINALKGRAVSEDTRKKIGDKNRKFSKEEIDYIVDLYLNKGYSQREIANITNSGKMTINRYLKPYHAKKQQILDDKIIKLLNQGVMQKEIAFQLGISQSRVTQSKQRYLNNDNNNNRGN